MKRSQIKRAAEMGPLPSPKTSESDDSVRSKLRDSLASALRVAVDGDKDRIAGSAHTVSDPDKDQITVAVKENQSTSEDVNSRTESGQEKGIEAGQGQAKNIEATGLGQALESGQEKGIKADDLGQEKDIEAVVLGEALDSGQEKGIEAEGLGQEKDIEAVVLGEALDSGQEKGIEAEGLGQALESGQEKGIEAEGLGQAIEDGLEKGIEAEGLGQAIEDGQEKGIEAEGLGQALESGQEKGIEAEGLGRSLETGQEKGIEAEGLGQALETGQEKGIEAEGLGQEKGIEADDLGQVTDIMLRNIMDFVPFELPAVMGPLAIDENNIFNMTAKRSPFLRVEHSDITGVENPSKRMKVEAEDKKFVVKAPDLAERVAFDIESEMYRYFGGVNRKYKEKARSLLFNLKDRSNPELRTRVLSGEITPENLCSMNAEQLASKELSEWRMAKAEEFAHMVVLTEPDEGQPRLVKKTHKGEVEVTVEKDDVLTEVVTAGAQQRVALPAKQEVVDMVEPLSGIQVTGNTMAEVNGGKKQKYPIIDVNLTAGSSSSEALLGSKKDLAVDAQEIVMDAVAANRASQTSKERAPRKNVKSPSHNSEEPGRKKNGFVSLKERKSEHKLNEVLWEGSFQLSGSEISPVVTIYKSGDAIELENWPKQIDIKGRVKLDALERFLQELRLSRARAVMITTCQVNGNESEHAASVSSLKEAANQYQRGERVGYAEPLPGFELYLFPGSGNSLRLLVDHGYLAVDQIVVEEEALLVGFIVCRRSLLPATTSHKPSSNYFNANKSALSARLDSPTRPRGAQWTGNAAVRSKAPPLLPLPTSKEYENHHHAQVSYLNLQKDVSMHNNNVEGNKRISRSGRSKSEKDYKQEINIGDDLPPGFGPRAMKRRFAMDESDDLPEYEFSSQTYSSGSEAPAVNLPLTHPFNMQGSLTQSSIGNPLQQSAARFNETSNASGLSRLAASRASGQALGYGRPPDGSNHVSERKPNVSHMYPDGGTGLQEEWARGSMPAIRGYPSQSAANVGAGQRGRASRLWNDDDDMPEWCPEMPQSVVESGTRAPPQNSGRGWQNMSAPLLPSSPLLPLEGGNSRASPAAQYYSASVNGSVLPVSRPEHYRSQQQHWPR